MSIQTARSQEKFIKSLADYTQDQSCDTLEYVTGQNVNGRKRAMDAVVYGSYAVSTANTVEAGSNTRIIKKAAHGARRNDFVQFTNGASAGVAIQILSCPDANTIILAATSEFGIAFGDTFDIKRYITPQYDSNGALSVVATQGPIQFNKDGVSTEVNYDTAVPGNSDALPVAIINVDVNGSNELMVHDEDVNQLLGDIFDLNEELTSETLVNLDTSGITNAGWTELIAATTNAIKKMTWFESSGFPMEIALGGVGGEIRKFVVPPGGFNGAIPMDIPAGSRISAKALTASAINAGSIIIANFYK